MRIEPAKLARNLLWCGLAVAAPKIYGPLADGMTPYRLSLSSGQSFAVGDTWAADTFHIQQEDTYLMQVTIALSTELFVIASHNHGFNDDASVQRLRKAVFRYGVLRIEHEIRDGVIDPHGLERKRTVRLTGDDLSRLIRMAREKHCDYQLSEGRDLLCTVATPVGREGGRTVRADLPVSKAICLACPLPDTDYLCSHFRWPQVRWGEPGPQEVAIEVATGLCDRGMGEINVGPEHCRAGGHACWEYLIYPSVRAEAPPLPPLAISRAIDHLDSVWRLAFGKDRRLRKHGTAEVLAKTALPCVTKADFDEHLTAVSDVLGLLDVPAELFAVDHLAGLKTISGSLARMDLLLSSLHPDPLQVARIGEGIAGLQSVVTIRRSIQHAGAAERVPLPLALERAGIPIPIRESWTATWNQVVDLTVASLDSIREGVQALADA